MNGVTAEDSNMIIPTTIVDSSGLREPPALSKIDCELNSTALMPVKIKKLDQTERTQSLKNKFNNIGFCE